MINNNNMATWLYQYHGDWVLGVQCRTRKLFSHLMTKEGKYVSQQQVTAPSFKVVGVTQPRTDLGSTAHEFDTTICNYYKLYYKVLQWHNLPVICEWWSWAAVHLATTPFGGKYLHPPSHLLKWFWTISILNRHYYSTITKCRSIPTLPLHYYLMAVKAIHWQSYKWIHKHTLAHPSFFWVTVTSEKPFKAQDANCCYTTTMGVLKDYHCKRCYDS